VSLRATAYYCDVRNPVVRRSAAAPMHAAPQSVEEPSVEERLRRQNLKNDGLNTTAEYTAKRAEILEDIKPRKRIVAGVEERLSAPTIW